MIWRYWIPGAGQIPMGRPRTTRTGHVYTPPRTEAELERVAAWLAQLREQSEAPTLAGEPCRVDLLIVSRQKARPRWQWASLGEEEGRKVWAGSQTGRADVDNLAKLILDAGTRALLWEDDRLIQDLRVRRVVVSGRLESGALLTVQEGTPAPLGELAALIARTRGIGGV